MDTRRLWVYVACVAHVVVSRNGVSLSRTELKREVPSVCVRRTQLYVSRYRISETVTKTWKLHSSRSIFNIISLRSGHQRAKDSWPCRLARTVGRGWCTTQGCPISKVYSSTESRALVPERTRPLLDPVPTAATQRGMAHSGPFRCMCGQIHADQFDGPSNDLLPYIDFDGVSPR